MSKCLLHVRCDSLFASKLFSEVGVQQAIGVVCSATTSLPMLSIEIFRSPHSRPAPCWLFRDLCRGDQSV